MFYFCGEYLGQETIEILSKEIKSNLNIKNNKRINKLRLECLY